MGFKSIVEPDYKHATIYEINKTNHFTNTERIPTTWLAYTCTNFFHKQLNKNFYIFTESTIFSLLHGLLSNFNLQKL